MANGKWKHSNNSQFFISFAPLPWLDGKHVVFGQVESGWNVLDDIEKQGTEAGRPKKPVEIWNCGEIQTPASVQLRSLTNSKASQRPERFDGTFSLLTDDPVPQEAYRRKFF